MTFCYSQARLSCKIVISIPKTLLLVLLLPASAGIFLSDYMKCFHIDGPPLSGIPYFDARESNYFKSFSISGEDYQEICQKVREIVAEIEKAAEARTEYPIISWRKRPEVTVNSNELSEPCGYTIRFRVAVTPDIHADDWKRIYKLAESLQIEVRSAGKSCL